MVKLDEVFVDQVKPKRKRTKNFSESLKEDSRALPQSGAPLLRHSAIPHTYFDALKKVAHPSTVLRSFSPIVFARDFGQKTPS
jgi:hypothetical protein